MKAKSPNNTIFLKIGSKVVFIDDDMPSHIMTVSGWITTEFLWMMIVNLPLEILSEWLQSKKYSQIVEEQLSHDSPYF